MTNIKNKWAIAGVLFSLTYIFLEITFNLGLVDFINSKNTEIRTFNNLETLGRILSSIGFSLFVTKILLNVLNKIHKFVAPVFFIAFASVFYIGETIVFNKIVDNLTPQQKFYSYTFGVYRNLSLNNQIEQQLFKGEEPTYDKVINSMLGILANKESIAQNVQNDTKNFFAIEFNLDKKSLSDAYDKLKPLSLDNDLIYNYYKRYVIESRRVENYNGPFKDKYIENFTKTIGIPPSLDRESFTKAFKDKYTPKIDYNKIVIVPKNDKIKMSQLTLADIPANLDKEHWIAFIDNHIQVAIDKASFSINNVDRLPHSRNIISSVIITPIAIILSLCAIVLNITLLLSKSNKFVGAGFLVIIVTMGALWSYNPYQINTLLNKVIGIETRFVQGFSPYKNVIHNTFVNDKNPNTFDIVRIEKPSIPDTKSSMDQIKNEFDKLSENNNQTEISQNKAASEIYVDDNKLNDKNYYGEVNKKNPYLK